MKKLLFSIPVLLLFALWLNNVNGAAAQETAVLSTNINAATVSDNCTYTIGYWKNHEEDWPVSEITIGGVTYSQADALTILNAPPRGDATYILGHQLIGSALNVLNGANSSDIDQALADANIWLTDNPLGSNPRGSARSEGIALSTTLDNYNNGIIGPGHCGDTPNPTNTPQPNPTDVPTNTPEPNPTDPPIGSDNCTYTIGYWKNHEEDWPVSEITIGGVTYSQAEALAILNEPTRGDATYILGHQLIGSTLNVLNGADNSDIDQALADANAWLAANPLGSNPSNPERADGVALSVTLDEYNNGIIGPGHCDDTPNPTNTPEPTPTDAPNVCTAYPLGVASAFNDFTIGNHNSPNGSDVEGRMAVGGDAILGAYSVGYTLSPSGGTVDVLIVGNDLTFNGGQVYNGNVVYGGTFTSSSFGMTDGTARQDTVIDFTAAEAELLALSDFYATLTANGTDTMQYGTLTLEGTNDTLNIFAVSASDIQNAHTLQLNIPAGATALINVSGTSGNISNMGLLPVNSHRSTILYNFYEATDLYMAGVGVEGSILAPRADVTFETGVIWGTLISASFTGQGQENDVLFEGCLPDPPTPEPTPEPTVTVVPPTATVVPPTVTVVPPTATNTPAPTNTPEPTATVVPPTATNTPIPTATNTPAPTNTPEPTATVVPPTATPVPQPLEIGNYVWIDLNQDGIQDAGETPIANVTVNLYDADGNLVASTTTDSNGEYYFTDANVPGGLQPFTDYQIRLDDPYNYELTSTHRGELRDLYLTTPNAGSDDELDSDAVYNSLGYPTISLTTGADGTVDYSFDFGLYAGNCVTDVTAELVRNYYNVAEVTNNSGTNTYLIGMASYERYDASTDTQVLYDSSTLALGPGESAVLTVDIPQCAMQLDLFCGPVLPSLDGWRYGNRLLDWHLWGGDNYCGIYTCPYTIDSITGVSQGETVSGNVVIGTEVGGGTPRLVRYRLTGPDGVEIDYVDGRSPYYFLGNNGLGTPYGWDSTLYPNGEYTLQVTVNDETEMPCQSQVIQFTVDNGTPRGTNGLNLLNSTGHTAVCTSQSLELVYAVDTSAGMDVNSVQQAIQSLNSTLAGGVHQAALVSFDSTGATVQSGFTTDMTALNNVVAGLTASGSADVATAEGLQTAVDTLIVNHNPANTPVIVLLTNNTPTVDLAGNMYSSAQAFSLYNASAQALSPETARVMGTYNPTTQTYAGQALADAMNVVEQGHAQLEELIVFGIGMNSAQFNADLLAYVAEETGGATYTVADMSELTHALKKTAEASTCSAVEQPVPVATCNTALDFSGYSINSYGDADSGVATLSNGGATIELTGNAWKSVPVGMALNPESILSFEFEATALGNVHAIGFDTDNDASAEMTIQLDGSGQWGMQTYRSQLAGTQRFEIPVGLLFPRADSLNLIFISEGGASQFSDVAVCSQSSEDKGTIAGYLQLSNGQAVANSTLTLRWAGADGVLNTADDGVYETMTGANGRYLEQEMPAGRYSISINPASLPQGVTFATSVQELLLTGAGNYYDATFNGGVESPTAVTLYGTIIQTNPIGWIALAVAIVLALFTAQLFRQKLQEEN